MASTKRSRSTRNAKTSTVHASSLSPTKVSANPPKAPRFVVVLGAGADYVYGVPMVGTLLPELATFAKGDGQPVHEAIRKKLPRIRFTFDKLAGDTSQNFMTRLFSGGTDDVIPLRSSVAKLKVHAEYASVGNMLERICNMAEENQLGDLDLEALAKVAGSTSDMGRMESILEPKGLSLTELPATVMRSSFHRALLELNTFDDNERVALELFIASMSNIEELLSEFFTLFLAGRSADQKNFLYVIWMLWAFLQSKSYGRQTRDDSIYQKLPVLTTNIITFNYTNFFLPITRPRVQYFHGRLDDILNLGTRTLSAPRLPSATPAALADFIANRSLDVDDPFNLEIPGIVPPTSFKPVMSRKQLLSWAKADAEIQAAEVVVVTGYSFAAADEHFNGLLRESTARVLVVNPDLGATFVKAAAALGVDATKLTEKTIAGHEVKASRRLTCIAATAEDVDNDLVTKCLA